MNEQIGNDICKNHTARTEKDLYRVCPSKLSRRELEDLYFGLLESNMELKKTVNGQREQIKLLNTKVQRMASQRPTNIREHKECCANNKAIINEQKEMIADLKESNDRLTERIRLLNMRLCSAKQFLKKTPLRGSFRSSKCCSGAPGSVKNSSTSRLNTRATEDSARSATASCQYLANETAPITSPIPESPTREQQGGLCDQNKCRTAMEELKHKTMALQQELSQTHEEYSSRIKRLEEEMSRLQKENVRVRLESSSSGRRSEQRAGEVVDLLQQLRKCEAQCEHLTVQLKIERSRTAELEMRARVADMSSDIASAIDKHLTNSNNKKEENEKRMEKKVSSSPSNVDNSFLYHCQYQQMVPKISISSQTDKVSDISSNKINRASDDSGYTDTNRSCGSCEESPKKDIKVTNQIAELQAQLDNLKQALGENCENENDTLKTMQSKRKPYYQRLLPSNNPNEASNCSATMTGDTDYLKRTNHLNSSKSTHEWHKDCDKSEASSSIEENRTPVIDSIKKDGRNSRFHKKDQNDMANAQKNAEDDINEMPKLDLTNVNETDEINKTYRKTNSLECINKDSTIDHGNKHIDRTSEEFTKEARSKVDGKLIAKEINQRDRRSESASHIKVDKGFQNRKESTRKLKNDKSAIHKNVASTNVCDTKEVIDRRYVSTGVDPINSLPTSPVMKYKDANAFTGVTNPLPLLEKNRLVRVCTCPVSARRAVAVFRSPSGALRFTTTASSSKFRRCSCGDNQLLPLDRDVEETYDVHRTSTPSRGTYVLRGPAGPDALDAVSSDDNTNCEISSLTDLSSEREVSRARASPGEDRAARTPSDGTPRSAALSEGELPGSERKQQSIGETQSPLHDSNLRRDTSTLENMEETLKEVSEEMSRCRRLLRAHGAREVSASYLN